VTQTPAYRIDGREVPASAFHAAACDPRRAIVVEACAGSGKTWLLVSRILRALLDGAEPQRILALTFTRKAAGEMRQRLDQWLEAFALPASASPPQLAALVKELTDRGVAAADAPALAPALGRLHARLLEDGRRVAIRSFHAWFAQLLGAAPLAVLRELGLPPQPALVEDPAELQPELFARFHARVDADAALRDRYVDLVRRQGRHRVNGWLERAWERRSEVEGADRAGTLEGAVARAAEVWPACAGLDDPRRQLLRAPLRDQLAALAQALRAPGGARARQAAEGLEDALAQAEPAAAFAAARKALFTDKNEPRALGGLPAQAAACDALALVADQLAQDDAQVEHAHMVALARVLLHEYARLKRRRGIADMADLEAAAVTLLSDPAHAGWVQQRLDTRLQHVLIDEFQDTSPLQWQALYGWLSAYAGAGGGASGQRPPSVFIVGDPKQSIYRFRRAEPRIFAAARRFVVEGLGGAVLECDHTRRCSGEVIDALNAVFGEAQGFEGFRPHTTGSAEAGAVRRLAEPAADAGDGEGGNDGDVAPRAPRGGTAPPHWRDTLTEPRHEPEAQRRAAEAERIAEAIAALLAQGHRPGAVMVLARKRVALSAIGEALAARDLPFVMPEPITVGEEPEALDLLAVLDALVSPGQDLSLARALRCPLFGASDADLLALARRATPGRWWQALTDAAAPWAGAHPALARARELLLRWAAAMAWLPPHDLLDRIVHEGDFVARLAAAAPPARRAMALGAVDALLRAALELDGARYVTPYGFVRALRARDVLIRPSAAADAIRLLTVHGAKGLEAEIVLVADTDPARGPVESGSLLADWPVDASAPARLAFVAVDSRPPPSLRRLAADEAAAQAREELNGLYVAMTRARQQLFVSRSVMQRRASAPTWWARLAPLADPWQPPSVPPLPPPVAAAAATPLSPPGGTGAAATAPQARPILLPDLPSHRAAPLAPPPAECAGVDEAAAALGRAVHRVLEWAGAAAGSFELPAAASAAVAEAGLDSAQAPAVAGLAGAVLASPACARFFDRQAIAWAGNEIAVALETGAVGRIDRLVAFDGGGRRQWWVLDYKLAHDPAGVEAYRLQLGAYAAAVRRLQPHDEVRAAFIAGGGRLVPLDEGLDPA
jgi:ATP-dependent helicase/nuclease subunit A